MNAKKISVIIPVYQVEKYIDICVQSVLKQTYTNLEIILVDDQSPDHCPEICDHYAASESRVIAMHQKNLGLSGARNTGLQHATGDYILFLDSDDYLEETFCEKVMAMALQNDADIVVGEISSVDEQGSLLNDDNSLHFAKSELLDNCEAMQALLEQTRMKGYAWGKLYRKSVVDGIEYPVGKVYEDRFTVPKYFSRAQKVCLCKDAVTYYRMRDTSISHDVSVKKLNDLLEAEKWLVDFCKINYPTLADIMESIYFGRYVHIWILLYDAGQKDDAKLLSKRMKEVYKNYASHPGIRKMHKISYRLIFTMPGVYRKLIRLMKKEQ